MSTEALAPKAEEAPVLKQKREAWGNLGVSIHKNELALQAKAQDAIQKIHLPSKITDVPEAEVLLRELKAIQQTIQDDRKKITSRFDELSSRLMQPEKSLTDPINNLAANIIKIKKEYEAEERKKQQKIEELKRIKQTVLNKSAEQHAEFISKIADEVRKAYEFALGEGDIKPAVLDQYLKTVKGKLNIYDFTPSRPSFRPLYADQADIDKVITEFFKIGDPLVYVQEYHSQTDDQFSDYDVAYENKKQALAFAEKERLEKEKKLEEWKHSTSIAAKLDSSSVSVPAEVGPVIKALKQSYEVDMAETVQSAIAIMAAFVGNSDLCLPKLKVNKWFSFTPAQAATALAKVKSDDNAFAPAGITFKTVDKL